MQTPLQNSASEEAPEIKIEQLAELVQSRTPLRLLVRWVAGIRASVHTKLLAAFLIVTAVFIAMALVSLQTIVSATRQSQLLDEAHELVSLAQQSEYALARQMHFTDLALLSQDEVAIGKILRENNRFNDRLAKVEAAGTAEAALVEQIRATQDEAMAVVADIANAIRDGKLGTATGTLLHRQERLDSEITAQVGRLVAAQQDRMDRLRDSVTAANRRSLILTSAFGVVAVIFALLCGFVISWSFILPVREAQRFSRPRSPRAVRRAHPGAQSRRVRHPGRPDEPHEPGAPPLRHRAAPRRHGARPPESAARSNRARRSRSSSPT